MNISIWHAAERTTKSYVPVCNLNSVLNVPLEDIIQLLMHYLIVFFLYAKNKFKKSKGRYTALRRHRMYGFL